MEAKALDNSRELDHVKRKGVLAKGPNDTG